MITRNRALDNATFSGYAGRMPGPHRALLRRVMKIYLLSSFSSAAGLEVYLVQYREHRGFQLPEVGIGCYGLSGAYGKKDIGAFKQVIRRAYALGVTFFDTAEAYGDAERILGETAEPFRDDILIATKVGVRKGLTPDLSAEYVNSARERSLKQLGTDYIDLYQVHFDDPETQVDATVETLDKLVEKGKVQTYEIGHLPMERAEEYFSKGNVFSMRMELSAVARDACKTVLPLCLKHHAAAIAFSTTGRGLMTGRFAENHQFGAGDIRAVDPLFQRERFSSGMKIAEAFANIARRHEKTSVQTAIAWVLAQPGVLCALTGPTTISHLEENVSASGWRFPAEDLEQLAILLEQEDAWLRKKQIFSVMQILSDPLPAEAHAAFTDLVYMIETVILLGIVSETTLLPTFQTLFALRDSLAGERVNADLAKIHCQLRKLIDIPPP